MGTPENKSDTPPVDIYDDLLPPVDNSGETKSETTDNTSNDVDPVVKFEQSVNEAVKSIKRGEDGKYVLPEGLSPEIRFAAIAEQRRRDTQSEYTKISQSKKALEVENSALKKKAIGNVKVSLTEEQEEELDNLKFSDPEAWRVKVNKYEQEALAKYTEELNTEITQISSEELKQSELERRKEVLKKFNQENPDSQLNDTVFENDIPPRISKRLETGEISFENFLQEAKDYLTAGKSVKRDKLPNDPNLSKVGGGDKPDEHGEKEDIILSYNNEIF